MFHTTLKYSHTVDRPGSWSYPTSIHTMWVDVHTQVVRVHTRNKFIHTGVNKFISGVKLNNLYCTVTISHWTRSFLILNYRRRRTQMDWHPEGIPIVSEKLLFSLDTSCRLDKHDTCATSSYTPLIHPSSSCPVLPPVSQTIKLYPDRVRVPTSPLLDSSECSCHNIHKVSGWVSGLV
jgi:hypothetical protein